MTDGHEPSRAFPPEADPHGQAALILVESLIHELMACDVLTAAQATNVLEIAHDAQRAIAEDSPSADAAHAAADILEQLLVRFPSETHRR